MIEIVVARLEKLKTEDRDLLTGCQVEEHENSKSPLS